MAYEITALEDNTALDFATLPPGKRALGFKWVYRIKYNANGSIEHYKVRLVAVSYTHLTLPTKRIV